MNRKINIVLALLLLTWVAGLCFSVSFAHKQYVESITALKSASPLEEHLSQEAQRRSAAWSEQTAPQSTAAHADRTLYSLLFEESAGRFGFPDLLSDLKTYKVILSFASLSEQFRILPNAP